MTPVICNSWIGKSHLVLAWFCGKGEKRLSIAKKRDPNQFQGALGAAGCNLGQYVRFLLSSINRAVSQSMGLAAHSENLYLSTGGEVLHSKRYVDFFWMWLCPKPAYIAMPKLSSNLFPCIAQMGSFTFNA